MRCILTICIAIACISGCQRIKYDKTVDYIPVYANASEGAESANSRHRHAISAMEAGNLEKAERICKQILSNQNGFAPAHNTLGTIYFQQGKYYPAAWEFEYAKRKMPQRPEPHNNLGLIYERVQRYPEALDSYAQAIEIEPANPEYLGNWIRLRIKQGDRSFEAKHALETLLQIESRPEWAEWARRQLAIGKFDQDCFPDSKIWPIENPIPGISINESLDGQPLHYSPMEYGEEIPANPSMPRGERLDELPNRGLVEPPTESLQTLPFEFELQQRPTIPRTPQDLSLIHI
jgi:tetratricopeptide (TPR) repeat protein